MERPLTQNIRPGEEPLDLKGYEKAGGYRALRKALKTLAPRDVTGMVKASGLRGRGGAGFLTGQKWEFIPLGPEAPHPKYLCCNTDEMEPGSFKDRLLVEGDPHQLVEAMIVSAYAVQAEVGYVFMRWTYKKSMFLLEKAIQEAYQAGYLGRNILGSGYSLDIHVHLSAGRYMCGEETGLLNALEGKRASPRAKPPHPPVSGLFGKPTVVDNAETLCSVPHIVNNGPEWFRKLSPTGEGGTKIYGVSGNVKRPGAWELPFGTRLREILEDHAGGMRDGFGFRALLPGGASTDFQVSLDVDFDFGHELEAGSRLGTGTIIVLDDRTCPVGFVLNIERFMARESCGWCTPCWSGLAWVEKTLAAIEEGGGRLEDLEVLERHVHDLAPGRTFCALAPGAMEPLGSALKLFREDFERHIREGRCPWR
jgi:NADH-quinone oxidoreductase subunit F